MKVNDTLKNPTYVVHLCPLGVGRSSDWRACYRRWYWFIGDWIYHPVRDTNQSASQSKSIWNGQHPPFWDTPREYLVSLVSCISHTKCPIKHSHMVVLYIHIYTSTYVYCLHIRWIITYPIVVSTNRVPGDSFILTTRLIEELTKQIFSSGFSAVRSRAMETATWQENSPWQWWFTAGSFGLVVGFIHHWHISCSTLLP